MTPTGSQWLGVFASLLLTELAFSLPAFNLRLFWLRSFRPAQSRAVNSTVLAPVFASGS